MSSDLEKYITKKLAAMQEEKSGERKCPNMVTAGELLAEIGKDVRKTLNKMFKAGTIKVHKTIHAPIQDFVELVAEKGE